MTSPDLRRERFSTLYNFPTELSKDSPQLRKRLARKLYRTSGSMFECEVAEHLEDELCIEIFDPRSVSFWEESFKQASLGQVLSAVTEVPRALRRERSGTFKFAAYLEEVNRIFQEEAAAYYVDERAVVHPRPDETYRRDYSATIAGLGAAGLEAAAAEVERADRHLLEDPADWARAIYSVFMACENVFKVITGTPRLAGIFIKNDLQPLLDARYAGEAEVVQEFRAPQLEAFYDWVKAAHNYRHAPGDPMPSAPPPELALQFVSSGLSYVRWLADVYLFQQQSAS